jgi:HprK-related kinase A
VHVLAPSRWRRYFQRQAIAWAEDMRFEPLQAAHAFTLLESALNWGVAASDVSPLVIHSAVLERDGRALIMPAPSGSGKSTLCAALAWRGWRLLSDEMAVFCFETGNVRPNPRPVSLKNESVGLVAAFEPSARFSRTYRGTHKGDIAYMEPPPGAVERADEMAVPALVVGPIYRKGASAVLKRLDKAEGFRWLADNSVNYSSMLKTGFEMLTGVVERCGFYLLTYSDIDEAIDLIDRLHQGLPDAPAPV